MQMPEMPDTPSYEFLEQPLKSLEASGALAETLREKLDAVNRKIAVLTDQTLMAVIEWNPELRVVAWNRAAEEIFGYTREEVAGRHCYFLIPDSFRPRVSRLRHALISKKTAVRSVNENLTKAGQRILCDWYNTPLADRTGAVIGVASVVAEVTTRETAEQNLKQSDIRFRRIIEDVSAISIKGYNDRREVIFWNRASQTLYGYTREEALGRKLEELIVPESMRGKQTRLIRRWLEFGEKIPAGELELRHKDGRAVPVFSSHVMHETRHGKEMFCIDVDLGPIRQVQAELQKSRDLFSLITGHTSALVFILDSRGNYIYASPSHKRLGYPAESLIGRPGSTVMAKKDVTALIDSFCRTSQGRLSRTHMSYKLKDRQGRIHFYRGSFDAVLRDDGSLEQVICVSEDITELTRAQAEKVEALSMAAETKKHALVGRVAGKMAHDFNNILSIIMGNAEMSMLDCRDEEIKESLELILDQTVRGRNLTKNLVVFAKDQEPKQEYFKVDRKIELVLNLLKKDLDGICLVREYSPGCPELLADPGMIEHALVNIFQNAIHATGLCGHPEIMIRTVHDRDQITIEIEDNGCGIPEPFISSIFEPSFTLKGSKDKLRAYKPEIKGTGYGMANVKKYIDQHKGKIAVRSRMGKGTCIRIVLPAIKKALEAGEVVQIKAGAFYREKHILLVEDEQAIADVQHRILSGEPCRHRVDIAPDGQAAMDLAGRNRYDLISLDYMLPGRINGMDVYRHIRKTDPKTPVIFISGNVEFLASIKELKGQDPLIDHLSKPCMNLDYIRGINRLLNQVENMPS